MKIDRHSLAFRLLIPILLAITAITAALFLAGNSLVGRILDDYHHYVAANQANETKRLYDSALAELTTARLLENPAVVAAKQEAIIEATALDWERRGVGGVVVDRNGTVLLTTFPPELTRSFTARISHGFVVLVAADAEYFGQALDFHPWGWRLLTVSRDDVHDLAWGTVVRLVALLVGGPLLMLAAVFLVIGKFKGQVDVMVAAVTREEEVPLTGTSEFDTVGAAYNLSLGRIRERTAALSRELVERKMAEEVIRRKESQISLLLHSASEGIFGVNLAGICTFCNLSCCKLLGHPEDQLLGQNIHELIHHTRPDGTHYPETECRSYLAFREGGEVHADDEVFWRADGTSFAVEYWSHPIVVDGATTGAIVTFFDITSRKEAEARLRRVSQEWQTTFDSSTDMIALLNPEGLVLNCNRAFAGFCGQEVAEIVGKKCYSVVHATDDHIAGCPLLRSRHSLKREEMELAVAGRVFNVVVDPILDAGGNFVGAVHTLHEITRLKGMEAELRAEKNKLEAIIAEIGDGISIQDRSFTVIYQNDVHRGFIGNHLGETCYRAYEKKEQVCQGCPVALSFADGKVHQSERRVEFPDGVRCFDISSSPLRDADGEIVAGIELVRDVTERKRAEEQLLHVQKMEGIGQLAGGVAHDFNNVLNVILGYNELLGLKAGSDKEMLAECVEQINLAVKRGAMITRQILAFSRKGSLAAQPVNLNELLLNLLKMLRRLVRENIEIESHLAEGELVINADPGQIDQILVNMATNASDAMPEGGRLTIETARITLDDDFVRLHGYGGVGDYALITVADTGVGMSEAVRSRIFEPFFTTKQVGKGTGLGLSMVYGIVRKHDGYINVYSEFGHGSVFRIYLPLSVTTREREGGEAGVGGDESFAGSETILVAEDEQSLRKWEVTVLGMHGYKVIEAVDGADAVQKFAAMKDNVDLVVLDGIMPNMNGHQAILEMRARRPELKAIVLSGYIGEVFSQEDLQALQVPFLQKPVLPREFLRTIRQVLDGRKNGDDSGREHG